MRWKNGYLIQQKDTKRRKNNMKTKVKKRVSIILTMALCITLGSSYVRADDTSASTAILRGHRGKAAA